MKKLLLLSALGLVACATNQNKLQDDYKSELTHTSIISTDTQIGVKKQEVFYQKKILLGEELRTAQIKAHELEARLYGGPRYYDNNGLIGVLKQCRARLAIQKQDTLQWTEKRDYVIPADEEFKMGISNNGILEGATEEAFHDRLTRYRQYRDVLQNRTEDMETNIAVCESQLKQRRDVASHTED